MPLTPEAEHLNTRLDALQAMIRRLAKHIGVRCGATGGERGQLSCAGELGHTGQHGVPTGEGKMCSWN